MKLLHSLIPLLFSAKSLAFTSHSVIVKKSGYKHKYSILEASTEQNEENTVQEKELKSPKSTGHDVGAGATDVKIDPEEMKVQQAYMKHQKKAAKLGWGVDIRSLIEYNHGFAVMSTNSQTLDGYPNGSVVGFAPDEFGSPLFIFSSMSSHTQDIVIDPKCSLTVAAKEFKGAADGRVNLMGTCKTVPDDEIEACKKIYRAKHPGAFWVDFGDFTWYRMDVEKIAFVGGFARAGGVTVKEYKKAQPDPVAAFGMKIAQHMNDDHMSATMAIVEAQIPGLDVTEAVIISVDSLGMYVKVSRQPRASDQPQQFKIRVPFPRQAKDRKDVKTLIVEMTSPPS